MAVRALFVASALQACLPAAGGARVEVLRLDTAVPKPCGEFGASYEVLKDGYLGFGATAIAFKVRRRHDGKAYAAKLMVADLGEEETTVGLSLARLEDTAPNFVQYEEAFECRGDMSAIDAVQEAVGKRGRMFFNSLHGSHDIIIMELGAEMLFDYLDSHELPEPRSKAMMFQLIFNLYMAWKYLDFQHFDVKTDNMYMRSLPPDLDEVCYFWDAGASCRCFAAADVDGLLTLWADFGFSTLGSCRDGDGRAPCVRHDENYNEPDLAVLAGVFNEELVMRDLWQTASIRTLGDFLETLMQDSETAPLKRQAEYSASTEARMDQGLHSALDHELFASLRPSSCAEKARRSPRRAIFGEPPRSA